MTGPVLARPGAAAPEVSAADALPPGDRYYRHPGDAVRLVLWGLAAVLLSVVVGIATATTAGVTADLGRVATRIPEAVRQLALALVQVMAVTVPVAVIAILVARRRWRRLGVVSLAAAAVPAHSPCWTSSWTSRASCRER